MLTLALFEIDGYGLFAQVGSHKIAVPILTRGRPSDIPVGISPGFSARHGCGLQLDHSPAQMFESEGGIGHREGLFHTENDLGSQAIFPSKNTVAVSSIAVVISR
jgi:hypothetical protein